MGKPNSKGGTFVTRNIIYSKAFTALNNTAKQMLLILMDKRVMKSTKRRKYECINGRELVLTYKELENLHNDGSGLHRQNIVRGFDDLLAKGFITVEKRGGAYQQDKNVYGLVDDWLLWKPGMVINKRVKGVGAGAFALKKPTTNM